MFTFYFQLTFGIASSISEAKSMRSKATEKPLQILIICHENHHVISDDVLQVN